jgi:hypothetical protein
VHNLESLAQLTEALDRFGPRREEGISSWRELAHTAGPQADNGAPSHRPLRATRHGQHWRTL